ncbi:prepilin peptidase [Catellatospora sp. TT07R-123]|uniref:prepilin peptidase n=1 Tax=Catellatospora sp. TT07R-123 TaxID=2733863 RepID=UPI001B0D4223|nr:prepilin peptidase [Catellatospora sp. TT07R-123]GHJ46719.1 prepilin peptidase [Catellatospora sp. TT07R-123]
MPLDSTVTLISAAVGAVCGALTPRIAYRLAVEWDEPKRTGCGACAGPFPPGRAGWLTTAARCPSCRAATGPSPWWTVPVGAVAAAGLGASLHGWLLAASLVLSVAGVLLAAIDLRVHRLPDPIVGATALGVLALVTAGAVSGRDWSAHRGALLGGLVLLLGYGLVSVLTSGAWGLGDAKLSGVLGLVLGWFGWGMVVTGVVLGVVVNGLTAIVYLIFRRIGRRDSLAIGPGLLVGAWAAIVLPVVFPVIFG